MKNNVLVKVLCILQTFIILFVLVCIGIIYAFNEMPSSWLQEMSPDGEHTIAVREIGIPTALDASMGVTIVEVATVNKNNMIPYLQMRIPYLGDNLTKEAYKIDWHDDYAKITFENKERGTVICRIYWEDVGIVK